MSKILTPSDKPFQPLVPGAPLDAGFSLDVLQEAHPGIQTFFQENILSCGFLESENEYELARVYYTKKYLPHVPFEKLGRFVVTRYLAWLRNEEKLLFEDENHNFLFLTAAKRGNKTYCDRVKRKLQYLPRDFFTELNRKYSLSESMTHFLFVTLTYPTEKKEGSWKDNQEFNRYMSRLKKIFPDITIACKTREATFAGVAHYHVLLFSKHGIPYYKNEGRLWLFQDDYTRIKKAWVYNSYLDIMGNPSGAYRHASKYITKSVIDSVESVEQDLIDVTVEKYFSSPGTLTKPEKSLMKHILTLAYSWAYGLRQYSQGRRWLDLIQTLTNSNLNYISHHDISDTKWFFLGVFPPLPSCFFLADGFYRHDEEETEQLRARYNLKRPTCSQNSVSGVAS